MLVRSRETPDDPLKYTIEYVQAALSLEKKLCVMLYDEGTRDHMLQEEKIFKDSSIVGFVADRAPQYPAIVKDLEGKELLRQACWFHARHYLAFMFGLLESCKLNKVNFGEYIEDILTRILCGEEVDASFLPCDYVRHFEDGTDAEVTKTSQAVA